MTAPVYVNTVDALVDGLGPATEKAENSEYNRTIEQAELATWATCPDKMLAYYVFPAEYARPGGLYRRSFVPLQTGARVISWLGTKLGIITKASVYGSNFGGGFNRIVSMRVAGTNGATYHGRASWDNSNSITLRRSRKGRTA